jgi:hypothetical protein
LQSQIKIKNPPQNQHPKSKKIQTLTLAASCSRPSRGRRRRCRRHRCRRPPLPSSLPLSASLPSAATGSRARRGSRAHCRSRPRHHTEDGADAATTIRSATGGRREGSDGAAAAGSVLARHHRDRIHPRSPSLDPSRVRRERARSDSLPCTFFCDFPNKKLKESDSNPTK